MLRVVCGLALHAALASAQVNTAALEEQLRALLTAAAHESGNAWARTLIQADADAAKLERSVHPNSSPRYLDIAGYRLTYDWNEIAGQEVYQHDLLQVVAEKLSRTPLGAEALAEYLRHGCGIRHISAEKPYFRSVLAILNSRKWHGYDDARLLRVRAEANETWWSLSIAGRDEPVLRDAGLRPGDIATGAETARLEAIKDYSKLLALAPNGEIRERLRKLRARQDTGQRDWYCPGD